MAAERTSGLAIILGFSSQNIANRRIGDTRRKSDGRIQFPINSENAVALPAKGAHNLEGIELSSHSYRSLPSPDCAMPVMACDRSAPRHSLTSMRFSVHERGRHGPARRSGT